MPAPRALFLLGAIALIGPAASSAAFGPAPQPRKVVLTTDPTNSRAPRHIQALRKGRLPEASARVQREPVVEPSRRLVANESARKPVRLKTLPKPTKVSFVPCGADLPAQAPRPARPKPGMDAVVLERAHRWPAGATLKIGFLDGNRATREVVANVARTWTQYANIELEFSLDTPPQHPDILILFDADRCSSKIGTTSRYDTERGEPSMHLCHLDEKLGQGFDPTSTVPEQIRRTVLHEFGHALGLHHEQQNPRVQIPWNKPAIYEYYATYYGWDHDRVDHNLFEEVAPHAVDASQYDPDSIMHYAFPALFTTNGVEYGGKTELSPVDKEHIAKAYPGEAEPSIVRRFERKIAVRNETTTNLEVQVVYETRRAGKSVWLPTNELSAAPSTPVPAGEELAIEGKGRWVKVLARSADGRSTWSEYAEQALRIAPAGGYLDVTPQTYVVEISGPPDPPSEQTREELYAEASRAQAAGAHEDARELFADFVDRFPSDTLVPWARFNIVVGWYEQRRWDDALQASYDLIVDHPRADATIYAWYYGGVTALQLGWCDGARSYLEYVQGEASGAPGSWRESAGEYLAAIEKQPDRWCQ